MLIFFFSLYSFPNKSCYDLETSNIFTNLRLKYWLPILLSTFRQERNETTPQTSFYLHSTALAVPFLWEPFSFWAQIYVYRWSWSFEERKPTKKYPHCITHTHTKSKPKKNMRKTLSHCDIVQMHYWKCGISGFWICIKIIGKKRNMCCTSFYCNVRSRVEWTELNKIKVIRIYNEHYCPDMSKYENVRENLLFRTFTQCTIKWNAGV